MGFGGVGEGMGWEIRSWVGLQIYKVFKPFVVL